MDKMFILYCLSHRVSFLQFADLSLPVDTESPPSSKKQNRMHSACVRIASWLDEIGLVSWSIAPSVPIDHLPYAYLRKRDEPA
jgi:hypothetical protein